MMSARSRFFAGIALVALTSPVYAQTAVAQSTASTADASAPPPSKPSGDAAATTTTQSTSQAPSDQDQMAGEIIVTAQGRAQRLQDVPIAVSVVTGTALVQDNITSLSGLSARLPALKIVSGPLTDLLNIRGVGSGQNPGFEQSVGTFVDGLYRGRSRATRAALFDIDRVEVLKGPQTTYFGNNAIAGALNITTRKPGDTFEYNASAYGDVEYGDYNVEGGVSVPLTDTLAVRVAGQASGMNGYIDNKTTGNDAPRQRNWLGRVALRWRPSSVLTSDLRFDIGRQRSRDAFSAVVLNCPSPLAGPRDFACPYIVADNGGPTGSKPFYTSYARPSFANYDFKEAEFTNVLDLGNAQLKSITGYFEHDYRSRVQLVPASQGGVQNYDLAPSPIRERIHQFSQELRLESNTDTWLEYTLGAYYSHLKTDIDAGFGAYFLPFGAFNPLGTTNANTPVTALNSQRYKDDSYSAFGALTIKPVAKLRINLGARYTSVDKQAHRSAIFGSAPNADMSRLVPFDPVTQSVFAAILGADTADFPNSKRNDHKFLPSAGVQYDLAPGIMSYFSYAKGFKAGGYSGQNTISVFNPETVNAYEVGVKSTLFDRRLTLNVDLFRSDYSDLQETTITFNPLPVTGVSNAASSRTQGIEINGDLRLTDHLRLTSDIAYLDAKYQNYSNGVCTMAQAAATPNGCVQDLSGKRRPYSPTWSGNVGADIEVPVADSSSIHIAPLAYFTTAFFTTATADPLLRQSGNVKADLRVSYGPTSGRWEFAVVTKNITNVKTAAYRNPITGGNGAVYALPDPTRSIAVQFTIHR